MDVNTVQAILSGGVPLDDYMKSMAQRRYSAELVKQIEDAVEFIHKTFNSGGAGTNLTRGEFANVYKVFRNDPSAVDAGFADMDLNHDDVITMAECNNNAQLYFGDAPKDSVSNSWPGPEITCSELKKIVT